MATDETCQYFYGEAYGALQRSVSMDEEASRYRARVHSELKAQINQLTLQVEHLQESRG